MTELIARNRFSVAGIGLAGSPSQSLVDSLNGLEQDAFGMRKRANQLREEARAAGQSF